MLQRHKCFGSNSTAWTGWTDEIEENEWAANQDSNPIYLKNQSFNPWLKGQPNGESMQNCASLYLDSKTWNDYYCSNSKENCAICNKPLSIRFTLRGKLFLAYICLLKVTNSLKKITLQAGYIEKQGEERQKGF